MWRQLMAIQWPCVRFVRHASQMRQWFKIKFGDACGVQCFAEADAPRSCCLIVESIKLTSFRRTGDNKKNAVGARPSNGAGSTAAINLCAKLAHPNR